MNSFDAEFSVDLQNILRPQVITASGIGADEPMTTGFDGRCRAIIRVGALSAGTTFTAKLEHADDSPGGPWTDVPGGAFAPLTVANTAASLGIYSASLKKFVRVNYTAAGGTVNLVASGFLVGFRNRVN